MTHVVGGPGSGTGPWGCGPGNGTGPMGSVGLGVGQGHGSVGLGVGQGHGVCGPGSGTGPWGLWAWEWDRAMGSVGLGQGHGVCGPGTGPWGLWAWDRAMGSVGLGVGQGHGVCGPGSGTGPWGLWGQGHGVGGPWSGTGPWGRWAWEWDRGSLRDQSLRVALCDCGPRSGQGLNVGSYHGLVELVECWNIRSFFPLGRTSPDTSSSRSTVLGYSIIYARDLVWMTWITWLVGIEPYTCAYDCLIELADYEAASTNR